MPAAPTLVVQAAIHGSEYPGIEAVWLLMRSLDPAAVHGRIIGVPVANVPAFDIAERCNGINHQDLNQLFPGNPRGTMSELTAHVLMADVTSQADYLVDLHASSDGEIVPIAIADGNHLALTLDFAKASGFEFLWVTDPGKPGRLGPSSAKALEQGIPATILEAGSARSYDRRYAERLRDAMLNVMRTIDMLQGGPARRIMLRCNAWGRAGGRIRLLVKHEAVGPGGGPIVMPLQEDTAAS